MSAYGTVGKAEEPAIDINDTLTNMACVLTASDHVENVELHLVDNPSVGFAQWRWAHFYTDLPINVRQLEETNGHLLDAMTSVRQLPDAGLDVLLHEGMMVEIMHAQIKELRRTHREMIIAQLSGTELYGTESDNALESQVVDRATLDMQHLRTPVSHTFLTGDGRQTTIDISPLARLGAGFIFSMLHNVQLEYAENMLLYREAEQAEKSGNERWIQRAVHKKRNDYFVYRARENGRPINHLPVGYNHDLHRAIRESNETFRKQMSYIVVTPKGLKKQ